MYRNSNRTPTYPCHDCSHRSNITDTDLLKRRRSNSIKRVRSSSNNKLCRNQNRLKNQTRYGEPCNYHSKDREILGGSKSGVIQKQNEVILVNITDKHTASGNYIGENKLKKCGKISKKSKKSSSSTTSKPNMRSKSSIKENKPSNISNSKKSVIQICTSKIKPTVPIVHKNVSEHTKPTKEDPIKNARQLANQIKTNIDSIRAQNSMRSSLQGLPQNKFIISNKSTPNSTNINTTSASTVTIPYLKQLRAEINTNRYYNRNCQPSCISQADQEIVDIRNEILQYKLKSEQDLPQAMVIEVSYINDATDKDCDENSAQDNKLHRDEDCSLECQHSCQYTLTDYGNIIEKPKINKKQCVEHVTEICEDLRQSYSNYFCDKDSSKSTIFSDNIHRNSFDKASNGIVHVSIKDKSVVKHCKKKKSGNPITEDGDSTGYAFDDLDADTVDTCNEDGNVHSQDESASLHAPRSTTKAFRECITSFGAQQDALLNKSTTRRETNTLSQLNNKDPFLNEHFLRDQIAGMKKIDKLVEEAEQSISKVVQGFDRYFKEPSVEANSAMSSESKRKDLKFTIDDSCDCREVLRCDCETKDTSDPITFPSDPDSDHLRTISERTEANVGSAHTSTADDMQEMKSIYSEISIPSDAQHFNKKNAKITIDTSNIVNIPPLNNSSKCEVGTETENVAANQREVSTGTSNNKMNEHVSVLGIQNIPGVEIRPSFVVQNIYNINIKPNSTSSNKSKKNAFYIELKHDDPVVIQMSSQHNLTSDKNDCKMSKHKQKEISVLKAAPTRDVAAGKKISKSYKCCKNKTHNKDQTIETLLDDIRAFQVPMVSTKSSSGDTNSECSDGSDYVVVQDNETQVSFKSAKDSKPSNNFQTCAKICASTATATSLNTFLVNVRPPVPGIPMVSYTPLPYDKEEIVEEELFSKSLDEHKLSKEPDTIKSDEVKSEASKSQDGDKVTSPVKIDLNVTDAIDCALAGVSSCDITLEYCDFNPTVLDTNANSNVVSNVTEMLCLANSDDYYTCILIESNEDINICCTKSPPDNQEPIIQFIDECNELDQPGENVLTPTPSAHVETSIKPISETNLSVHDSISSRASDGPAIVIERVISEYTSSNLFSQTPELHETVPMDIEGVQITQYSELQDFQPPLPQQVQVQATTMPAMVRYDQRGVNESLLAQNLLLAQLGPNVPPLQYLVQPIYIASTSSDSSSHSNADYPERHKYLMRAKRKQLTHQRGIITDLDDDFNLSDALSDGELSRYTSSSGEVLPIGPSLLKNKNFMRRRPDKVFQMELNQRNLHIQRQHNYFNNWVSYYVADNTNG